MSGGVARVKGIERRLLCQRHWAQVGWYHGFLRPIVGEKSVFLCLGIGIHRDIFLKEGI